MRQPDNNSADDNGLEAPPRLISGLKRLSQEKIFVPPTVDEAILGAARKQLCPTPKHRSSWLRFMPWAAGAAAAALVMLLTFMPWRKTAEVIAFKPQDVTRDGVVDILDAFALARELEGSAKPDQSRDMNHDGRVDEADVAWLATAAVQLERSERL